MKHSKMKSFSFGKRTETTKKHSMVPNWVGSLHLKASNMRGVALRIAPRANWRRRRGKHASKQERHRESTIR